MTLIGIAGPARAGKDTVAAQLRARGFETMAFAEPLRWMLYAGLGIDPLSPSLGKEEPIPWIGRSPRELLQTLGTEWGRELINPDLWVIRASQRLWRLRVDGVERIVFTDVRFENEAAWIRSEGGAMWHVERPEAPAVNAHVSETGVIAQPGDQVIRNDGSLTDLAQRISRALASLEERHSHEQ